jgi:DNA-binding CsgD family transcriptional regulator
MIHFIVQRTASRTFRKSFGLILLAEAITILVAWRLLDFNIDRWLQTKTASVVRFSQKAAAAADWSQIDKIRKDDAAAFDRYSDELSKLSSQYFVHDEGSIYLAFLKSGEEYDTYYGSEPPLEDAGKANQWVLTAYKTGKMAYSPDPIVDDTGTYLAAYVPILREGKVIGLVTAEFDSAPLADFQSIVSTAFWFSIIPAVLISLVVAYVLSSIFVEPMDLFRTIADTANSQRDRAAEGRDSGPWSLLTARQRQVADLVRQGKSYREMAEVLSVSTETVKQHLKDIKARTGCGRVELAIVASAQSSPPTAPAST